MQRWDARVASRVCSSLAALLRLTETISGAPPCTRVSFFAPPKKETKERRSPNRVGLRPIPEFGQRQAGSAELALFSDTPAAHPKNRGSDNCASFSAWHCPDSARLQGGGKTTPLPHPNPPLCTGEGIARDSDACGGGTPARTADHLIVAAQPRCACRTRVCAVAITGTVTAGFSSSSSSSATARTGALAHAVNSEAPLRADALPPIPSPETRGGSGWGSACELPRPSEAPLLAADWPKEKRSCSSPGFWLARSVGQKRASSALPADPQQTAGTLRSRALSGPRLSLPTFFGGAKKVGRVQGAAPADASIANAARGCER